MTVDEASAALGISRAFTGWIVASAATESGLTWAVGGAFDVDPAPDGFPADTGRWIDADDVWGLMVMRMHGRGDSTPAGDPTPDRPLVKLRDGVRGSEIQFGFSGRGGGTPYSQ